MNNFTLKVKKIISQEWVVLRQIGNSKFINSMYIWIFIVPVVAKLFEHLGEDILNFVVFQQQISFSPNLPFSWKVFYFSAMAFAISNLIVKIRCPKIIKDHLSFQSYKDEGKTLKQLGPYCDETGFNWGVLAGEVDKQIPRLQVGKSEGDGGIADNYPSLSTEDPVHYFWPIFEHANILHPIYRFLCTFLYGIGFILFGLVVIQNTLFVI